MEVGVLCQNSNEYQADIQARDTDMFEMKELIFKLAVDIDYCREDIKKAQHPPEGAAVGAEDQTEQMRVLRRELDESRRQLERQEKKFQEGEQQMLRLQEEIATLKMRPKPERQEGL